MADPRGTLWVRGRSFARARFPGVMQKVRPYQPYPNYFYGVTKAARLAKALGIPAISVLELGVAGGNGLVNLEDIARKVSAATGVKIQAVGFDLGSGMPMATDYRDLPYIWQSGFYEMDVAKLKSRLTTAELVLGDIEQTGREWIASKPAPIGFISFDLDYYSSTMAAFNGLLEAGPDLLLPRVFAYFDDIIGDEEEYLCEYVGELLAIKEFNESHEHRKLAPINGLRLKLPATHLPWPDQIYVLHVFDHPEYVTYVRPESSRQLPLGG